MNLHREARQRMTQRLLAHAMSQQDTTQRWDYFSAAHIVGQPVFTLHLATHWAMLRQALRERDWGEVGGQLFRLALIPLGHLVGRLPLGNPGRANVSAFAPMAVAPQLQRIIEEEQA